MVSRGLTDQEYCGKAESNLTGEAVSWNSGSIPQVQDQLFVKEVTTKGYYEGVKKLNKERTTNVSKQKAI